MRTLIPVAALLLAACAPKQQAPVPAAASTGSAAVTASASPESEAAATQAPPCVEEDVEPVVRPSTLLNARVVEETERPCARVPDGAGDPTRFDPAPPSR